MLVTKRTWYILVQEPEIDASIYICTYLTRDRGRVRCFVTGQCELWGILYQKLKWIHVKVCHQDPLSTWDCPTCPMEVYETSIGRPTLTDQASPTVLFSQFIIFYTYWPNITCWTIYTVLISLGSSWTGMVLREACVCTRSGLRHLHPLPSRPQSLILQPMLQSIGRKPWPSVNSFLPSRSVSSCHHHSMAVWPRCPSVCHCLCAS